MYNFVQKHTTKINIEKNIILVAVKNIYLQNYYLYSILSTAMKLFINSVYR